ncbi:MAG TPA: WD40 repeat domain-containing protein [Myxococcales bacterium]
MGKVGKWALAVALCAGCGKGSGAGPGTGNVAVDGGVVSTQPPPPPPDDGGPGTQPPPDGGIQFGGPGPWPIKNVIYGAAEGIRESPVVAVSTDETQNLWVATNAALYVMRPGDTKFMRFDGTTGANADLKTGIEHKLHLPGTAAAYCFDQFGFHTAPNDCGSSSADTPGITTIVGGGPNEVFVGYWGHHDWTRSDDGTWSDPFKDSGKMDHVRLNADGTIDVVRFQLVATDDVVFWHNKSVWKMVYDHFTHKHELYVGADHGVDKITPDKWKMPDPGTFFTAPQNEGQWMSDHLHPQACRGVPCDTPGATQLLGDWRGLAIDPNGDLWVGGRWAAGKLLYTPSNNDWWHTPRPDGKKGINPAYGDANPAFFSVPVTGDPVNISAMAIVPKKGTPAPGTYPFTVWAASGTLWHDPADVDYGIASSDKDFHFTHYDPIRDAGMSESGVHDMVALPDGRLVLAGSNTGLVFWDPNTGRHTAMRAGQGIPDDHVMGLELDTMVDPPALHVATGGGAAVIRVFP